jgi:hypothetical protein
MNYWNSLQATITSAIQADRIGQPVFLRLTAVLEGRGDELVTQLADMILLSSECLGTTPGELFVSGDQSNGHLSATVEFETSVTAIITLARHGQPRVDLALYGNQGSIIHGESIEFYDGTFAPVESTLRRDELIARIVRSLSQHIPVQPEVGR